MTRIKRYVLKKDLPTFNAGDEFELREDGCLYRYNDNVMAYSRTTLERFPSVLEDWFEEITGDHTWTPEPDAHYYFIDDMGDVEDDWRSLKRSPVDSSRIRFGNCFRTYDDAVSAKSIMQDAMLNFKERRYGKDE